MAGKHAKPKPSLWTRLRARVRLQSSVERRLFGPVEGTLAWMSGLFAGRSVKARTVQAALNLDRASILHRDELFKDARAAQITDAIEVKERELTDLLDRRINSLSDPEQRIRFAAAYGGARSRGLSRATSLRIAEDASTARQKADTGTSPIRERFLKDLPLADQFQVMALVGAGLVSSPERAVKEKLIRQLPYTGQKDIRAADGSAYRAAIVRGASRAEAHQDALKGRYFELERCLGKSVSGTLSLDQSQYDLTTIIQILPPEARKRVVDKYKESLSNSNQNMTERHAADVASEAAAGQLKTELFCLLPNEVRHELNLIADGVSARETAAGRTSREIAKSSQNAFDQALAGFIGGLLIKAVSAPQLGLSATDVGLASPASRRRAGRHSRR